MDYIVSQMLGRPESPAWRRFWIATSICVNLGVLGLFKYFNFFISSASGFLAWLGLPASVNTLNIIVPVGISFYTFHSMSYTIDVYRRKQRPISNFVDLSLFVSFFPPLVAGPIVRAVYFSAARLDQELFQCRHSGRGNVIPGGIHQKGMHRRWSRTDRRPLLCSSGGFHGNERVDWRAVLRNPDLLRFFRYTDMAIAAARLLGYQLPNNFQFPSFARNVSDFWRRWHISLSSWLRDYLYIPLGGNPGSRTFVYRNVMITMLLGGLWRGAAWTFIIWGALPGTALLIHGEWMRLTEGVKWAAHAMRWLRVADYDFCSVRCLDLFPRAGPQQCGNDIKAVHPFPQQW